MYTYHLQHRTISFSDEGNTIENADVLYIQVADNLPHYGVLVLRRLIAFILYHFLDEGGKMGSAVLLFESLPFSEFCVLRYVPLPPHNHREGIGQKTHLDYQST